MFCHVRVRGHINFPCSRILCDIIAIALSTDSLKRSVLSNSRQGEPTHSIVSFTSFPSTPYPRSTVQATLTVPPPCCYSTLITQPTVTVLCDEVCSNIWRFYVTLIFLIVYTIGLTIDHTTNSRAKLWKVPGQHMIKTP